MKPPYGVLLVGGARTHQENYGRYFAAEPRCRLVAVADEAGAPPERHALNQQLAGELGLPYLPDLDAALARADVQIVSVCPEVERRGRVASRCAAAGKHLYLDKPISGCLEDGEAIAAAVEGAGVVAQMFSYVHSPWAQAARRSVQSGTLGALRAVHVEVLFAKGSSGNGPVGTPRAEGAVHGDPIRYTFPDAKRELFDIGVYAAVLVRWLTGREVSEVYGHTANYFFESHARRDVEDFGLLTLALEGGVTATVAAGRIGWQSHPRGGPQRIYLFGNAGHQVADAWSPHVAVWANEPAVEPPPPHPDDPMGMWRSTQQAAAVAGVPPLKRRWLTLSEERDWAVADVRAFLNCIETGRTPEVTARDGLEALRTILAGYESAATGAVVAFSGKNHGGDG